MRERLRDFDFLLVMVGIVIACVLVVQLIPLKEGRDVVHVNGHACYPTLGVCR